MIGVHQLERMARQSLYADWLAALRELHEAEHDLAELGPDDEAARRRWEAASAKVQALLARAKAMGARLEPTPAQPVREARLMDAVMLMWAIVWGLIVVAAVVAR